MAMNIADVASTIALVVVGLAYAQNVAQGTAREWVAAKFLNRGAPLPARPSSGGGSKWGSSPDGSPGAGDSPGTGAFGDPYASGRFVSGFGASRAGGARKHEGIDIAGPAGDVIQAAAAGEVVRRGQLTLCGKRIAIRHANGYETIYCHLSNYAVSVGDSVRRGQVIGYNGSTGNASAALPHLHFEIRRNGQPVNPAPLIGR